MQRGISDNEQHPAGWERQREQLSAYLDGTLDPTERAELGRHLTECPACQDELQDLRDLRALLRALPTPALPRSFVLSDDSVVPLPIAPRRETAPVPARAVRRGPRVVEWAGALAASLGLALLFTTALVGRGGTAASPVSAQLGSNGQTAQAAPSSPKASSAAADQSHTPSSDPGAAVGTETSGTPTTTNTTPGPTPSDNSRRGEASTMVGAVPPLVPIGGAGLFIGGAVVFVVGRSAAKRRGLD